MNLQNKSFLKSLSQNKNQNLVIFGSSRTQKKDANYKMAYTLSKLLVENGKTIITGSGMGIMEAANKGAWEISKKKSIGFNVLFTPSQPNNKYISTQLFFNTINERKNALFYCSNLFICFPGGIGSLDEFINFLTLKQCFEIKDKTKFILVNSNYWNTLLKWLKEEIYESNHFIDADLLTLYSVKNNLDEILNSI